MMVISRTPFRISLAGGGSDFREYYRHGGGAVVSMAIDRYMYVTVNRRLDDRLRVSYTRTEIVDHVDDLQHDIIREALRRTGLTRGYEVTTIADLPAGIGLGSSSTLAVGTLNALYAMRGDRKAPGELAREAAEIEIDVLGHPIGKQDQYIAAFGGLQHIRFHPDERVTVEPVICALPTRARLIRCLMLFFTGTARHAGSVLTEAKGRLALDGDARKAVDGLVGHTTTVLRALATRRLTRVGEVLDASWHLKKQLASNVTTPAIDRLYRAARKMGAVGGKIAGAGGGGCLLLFVPPGRQAALRRAFARRGLHEVRFTLEPEGSRIIYFGR